MLVLQNISYTHANGDTLFGDIDLSLAMGQKVALTGNNGTGNRPCCK
ncbi:hypothetical protein [Nemorincola caseinilytica]